MSQDSLQVEVRFTTRLPESFQIPDDSYVIDSSVSREGLSELINSLLSLQSPVPFDFLVNGKFLRSSLAEHYEASGLSSEVSLTLEYVKALTEPETSELSSDNDWLSGLAVSSSLYASSSMSGVVSLFKEGKRVHTIKESSAPLTCVALSSSVVVSGGKDGAVRMHLVDNGHLAGTSDLEISSSIQAVAFSPEEKIVVSGDYIGRLALHVIPENPGTGTLLGKRTKTPSSEPTLMSSTHSEAVTAVVWKKETGLLSASMDGTVGVWDSVSLARISSLPVGRAATALAAGEVGVVVTGHDDGRLAFWDSRAGGNLEIVSAYKSHARQVACISLNPDRTYQVASAGQDGALKIFDSRAPKFAVQSIYVGGESNRLLACVWRGGDCVLSGGSDGKVREHRFNM